MSNDAGAEYTHGYHPSVLRSHQNRNINNSARYAAKEFVSGRSVLDVGSGAGTLTVDIAQAVHPSIVTALEFDPEAMEVSKAEFQRRGATNIDIAQGDVHALPFEDNRFDVVHAHQVLQHVHDPVQALKEMRRVCKVGGVVAVRDSDYRGFAWYPEDPRLTQWLHLYDAAARDNGGEPDAGRMLYAWAKQAGFKDVEASSSTWCYATPETRAWWGGMWADRILHSKIATQLLDQKRATPDDLQAISSSWKRWAADEHGWFSLLHGEILCRKQSN